MISRPARTSPARALFVSSAAVDTATTSSPAVQSSRCRSMGWSVANTSVATWSAILASPRAKWRAAATGSGVAPTARAARTIAAHHPWAWALIASKTSTEVVRAWSAMSAAASSRSIRSTSPRRTVMCPSSSGTNRVRGRSQRLSMSTRRLCGARGQPLVDEPQRRRRQVVRVVHHDESWRAVPVGGSVEQLVAPGRRPTSGPRAPTSPRRARAGRRSVLSSPRTPCSQADTPSVLPAPAGATSRVTGAWVARSSWSASRRRGT